MVNDMGYTKRYVRCLQVMIVASGVLEIYILCFTYAFGWLGLKVCCSVCSLKNIWHHFWVKCFLLFVQISEVVNSMKDLIDFSRDNNIGPTGKPLVTLQVKGECLVLIKVPRCEVGDDQVFSLSFPPDF